MPGLSFVHPETLWLLGLVGAIWLLALATPRRLSPARFYGSLALRSAIVAALVFAISGAQLTLPNERITTVFLLDASDSISPSARAQAESLLQEALQQMPPDHQAAIVVFGENALVERAPGSQQRLSRISSRPVAARTDIGEAIQLGLALLPADSQQRLVLLSDGGENDGRAIEAARLAAARGVPIEVVDLSVATADAEALLLGVEAPARARDGQELTIDALVESSVAQGATVRLLGEAGLVQERRVDLAPGQNRVSFRITAGGGGFQRYSVELAPDADGEPANNLAGAMVQIEGPPRLLVVAQEADAAAALMAALAATRMVPELVAPAEMPADLAGLSAYEAVLLVNVPARAIPVGAMGALPAYVRDLGKGLVMIGGEESFGVGGYGHTPVEEALPVYMDVRDREEHPDLAIVFVIDKSGSMDSCHCNSPDRRAPITGLGGYGRKIDIAKEAVAQAAGLLGEHDTIGVIAFDRQATSVLPATRGPALDDVVGSMAGLDPRGSTNVRNGLLEAEAMLAGVDAKIKHVILLTDGWGAGGTSIDVAERMRGQGMTLTVVAAGGGSAGYLENLATAGGGRFYPAAGMEEVPQIFVQETITTVGNYIVERPFTPTALGDSPVLAGISALPQLYGFNGSTIKESARRVLMTDDEQPLLATWQYGLGRSAAWLSDARAHWARDWMAWEGFPRFAAQLAQWVLPVRGATQTTAEVHVSGGETTVRLLLGADAPQLAEPMVVTATLIYGDGSHAELALARVAPESYQAQIASPPPGTYLVQLAGSTGGQAVLHETAGMVVPYSAEYSSAAGNPRLLDEIAALTGGGHMGSGADAFAPLPGSARGAHEVGLTLLALALALLPVDIALRRIAVRVRK